MKDSHNNNDQNWKHKIKHFFKNKTKVRIEGDHSSYHCGSAAVFRTLIKSVKDAGGILTNSDNYDLLIVNGEGSMHHDSNGMIKKLRIIENAISNNKRVFLVNTVWQQNSQKYADILHGCEKIFTREVLSQRTLASQGIKSDVCIDLSYFDVIDERAPAINFEGAVVFTDFYSKEFNTFVWVNSKEIQKYPSIKMDTLSWSSMVNSLKTASCLVTGRHHAIYAACKARCPFIAMPGNTHKIEGLIATSNIEVL